MEPNIDAGGKSGEEAGRGIEENDKSRDSAQHPYFLLAGNIDHAREEGKKH